MTTFRPLISLIKKSWCSTCDSQVYYSMLMKKSLLGGTILHGQWQCLTLSSPGDCWMLWSAEPPSPKQQWQEQHQAAVTDCCWRLRFSDVSLPLGHHSQSVFAGEAKIITKKKLDSISVLWWGWSTGKSGNEVWLCMSAMCIIIMQATRRAETGNFTLGSQSHISFGDWYYREWKFQNKYSISSMSLKLRPIK